MVTCDPDAGPGGPLIRKLLLDRIEQGAVHDWWLLAGQDVALVSDLADIEPVAQEIEQCSPLERDSTAGAASCKQPRLGADVAFLEISNQGIDAAKFAAISRAWWSPISGLCAETSTSGPFLRRLSPAAKIPFQTR